MEKILTIMLLMCMSTVAGIATYIMYRDTVIRKEKQDFDKQIIIAQSNAKVTTSFEDGFKIVDKMIAIQARKKINHLDLSNKTPEQLSVLLDDVISEMAGYIVLNVSDALKRQLYNYITEDYLMRYISDNCRNMMIIQIESLKHNV